MNLPREHFKCLHFIVIKDDCGGNGSLSDFVHELGGIIKNLPVNWSTLTKARRVPTAEYSMRIFGATQIVFGLLVQAKCK